MASDFSFAPGTPSLANKSVLKPQSQERPLYRAVLLMLFTTLIFILPIARLVQLQILNGAQNRERAENNRIRHIPIPSNRGQILDRKGKPLAANHLTRSVYLWPREQTPEQWRKTATELSSILKIPPAEIINKLERVSYLSERDVRIFQNLTPEAFVALSERASEFRGVEIRAEASRYYPHKELASHILGYIGEATEDDLAANPDYPMGMVIGQMGIEAGFNEKLSGTWGYRLVEVNGQNEEIQELGEDKAIGGETLQLTVDLDLQRAAEQALGDRRGGVAVLDVKTGGVLALASYPRFDPNIFTRKVTDAEWERLQGPDKPFVNRALQGYPPGSTFKIVTSAAGIGSGQFYPDSIIGTSAYIQVGGIRFNEHSGGYGYIGFRDALAFSSNTFFYQIGLSIGPEPIALWAHNLGLGKTDFQLLGIPSRNNTLIPTPEDKEAVYNEPWYAGDSVTMSIGQGMVLATPLDLAVMVASIANGGKRVKPHLLASLSNTEQTKPEPTGMAPETVRVIREGLVGVVEYGTAQVMKEPGMPLVGGKTGTSEVQGQTSHSVFVSFGPAHQPEIAIAVVVENGGFGSRSAAPVAKQIFQTYFNVVKKAEGNR